MRRLLALTLPLALLLAPLTAAAETEDYEITGGDIVVFLVGSDATSVRAIHYVVDRTAGLCFVHMGQPNASAGVAAIDCKPLEKYPAIKAFIETGKRP